MLPDDRDNHRLMVIVRSPGDRRKKVVKHSCRAARWVRSRTHAAKFYNQERPAVHPRAGATSGLAGAWS